MFSAIKKMLSSLFEATNLKLFDSDHDNVLEPEEMAKRDAILQFIRDILITLGLIGLSLLAIIPMWYATQTVFYVLGVTAIVALFAHIMQRLLFPTVNIGQLLESVVRDNNVAAAIVIAAIIYFFVSVLAVAPRFFNIG